MGFLIRNAKESDSEFIYQTKKQSLFSYVDEIWGWDEDFQRQRFNENLKLENIQIIETKKDSIGILEIEFQDKEINLVNIEIEEHNRNHGIGTILIKDIIKKASIESKPIVLRVFKKNEKAIRFYKKNGFVENGESEYHLNMKMIPVDVQIIT